MSDGVADVMQQAGQLQRQVLRRDGAQPSRALQAMVQFRQAGGLVGGDRTQGLQKRLQVGCGPKGDQCGGGLRHRVLFKGLGDPQRDYSVYRRRRAAISAGPTPIWDCR